MIANFCTPYDPSSGEGYGSIEYDAENNLISNSASRADLQGKIDIQGYAFRNTINKIRNYFGENLTITVWDYYNNYDDAVWNKLLADKYGDGTGVIQEWLDSVKNVSDLPSLIIAKPNLKIVDLKDFHYLTSKPYYSFSLDCVYPAGTTQDKIADEFHFDTLTKFPPAYLENGSNTNNNLTLDKVVATNVRNRIAVHESAGHEGVKYNVIDITFSPDNTNPSFHGYFLRNVLIGDMIIRTPNKMIPIMYSGWGSDWDSIKGYIYVDDDMVNTYKNSRISGNVMQWANVADKIKPLSTYVYHKYFNF